jgi:hypothetical protein
MSVWPRPSDPWDNPRLRALDPWQQPVDAMQKVTPETTWQAKLEALPVEYELAIEATADSLPSELEITDPEGFAREIYRRVTGKES